MDYKDNDILWCDRKHGFGRTFRKDGPCYIGGEGKLCFSQVTYSRSRKQGPSEILPDGCIIYTNLYGWRHRIDGPALIFANGYKEYWVDGDRCPPEEFFLKYGVL